MGNCCPRRLATSGDFWLKQILNSRPPGNGAEGRFTLQFVLFLLALSGAALVDYATSLRYNPSLLYILIVIYASWRFPRRLIPVSVTSTLIIVALPRLFNPQFYRDEVWALDLITEMVMIATLYYALTQFRWVAAQLIAEQRRNDETKQAFIATLSHEFRTPITVIDGHAQQLLSKPSPQVPEDVARRAGKIREAVVKIRRLIDGILMADRIERARLVCQPVPTDLMALVEDCCRRLIELHPGRPLRLHLADLPPIIECDGSLIEPLIDNLLANAAKYSPGDKAIEVLGRRQGDWALLTIKDAGSGILPEDLPHIFKNYYRGRNAVGVDGFGIGLHLAQCIAHQHGGEIVVDSTPGQGSAFTLRLPVTTPRSGQGERWAAPSATPPHQGAAR